MAAIGRNAAVVDLRGFRYAGFPGFVTWALVHIGYLVGYRNRALVLAGWFQYYAAARPSHPAPDLRRAGPTALEVAGEPVTRTT